MNNYIFNGSLRKKLCGWVVAVSFLLLAFNATGQDRKFRFGLGGGAFYSWLKMDTKGIDSKGSLGYNYGIMTDYALNDNGNYNFSSGLNITTIRGKQEFPDYKTFSANVPVDTFATTQTNLSLRYVEIPLLIKMKTNEIGYLTYFGQFGFGTGFEIKARADSLSTLTSDITISKKVEDIDISENTNLFRLSLIVSAGAEYNLSGNTSAVFGVSFNNGFTNVFRSKEQYYELDDEGKVVVENGEPKKGTKLKAVSNFFSLYAGVFF